MKKGLVVCLILLVFLTGCSFSQDQDYSEEHLRLKQHFKQYLDNDIEGINEFVNFINEVAFKTSLSGVRVKVRFFDDTNNLVETRNGSGVIFDQSELHIYVLSVFELSYTEEDLAISYEIFSNEGKTTTAEFLMACESSKLMVLRVLKGTEFNLPPLTIASKRPLYGEPVLLIGNQAQVIDAKSMGLYLDIIVNDEESPTSVLTSIETDLFGNGGGVINTRHELVGVQIGVASQKTVTVTFEQLQDFISNFNEKKEC